MSVPDSNFEILPWDSDVFGFPVARVEATEDENVLGEVLDDARRAGVRLIYLFAEGDRAARAAEVLNGKSVGERLVFTRDLVAEEAYVVRASVPVAVERFAGSVPTDELLQLSREAGRYSRFRVDSRVPVEVFRRIYDAWMENSLSGQLAKEVLVIRDASSMSGVVTVGSKRGRADIGLLAVREDARGRGLGRALVQAFLAWGSERQFRVAQVVTQRANVAACHLYTSCGYKIEREQQVFHFWL